MNSQTKICNNCKQEFTIDPEDFAFYERIAVPPPTWCPKCRLIRRLMLRNERTLYRATCNLCGKSMISTYAPESPFVVYCKDCWFSDKWNPLDYARQYDWQQPFFKQFFDLKQRVPRVATMQVRMNTNSEYANFLAEAKNAYLAYSIVRSEDVMYSRVVDDSRNCLDCSDVQFSELVYEAIQSDHLNHVRFVYSCINCIQ